MTYDSFVRDRLPPADQQPEFLLLVYPACLNAGNPNDAGLDCDNDGLTNLEEYTAGTDPQDPQSYLRVEDIDTDPNGVAIEFTAVSNKTYSLVWQPNADGTNWMRLLDIAQQSTTRTELIIITTPPPVMKEFRFFRLVTPRAAPGGG